MPGSVLLPDVPYLTRIAMHRDDGLVTPDEVRKVLAAEEGDRYKRLRAAFRDREKYMAKNLTACPHPMRDTRMHRPQRKAHK